MTMSEKRPALGVLDFWKPPPAPDAKASVQRVALHPVRFEGRVFMLVIDAPDQSEAEAIIGRLLQELFDNPKTAFRFKRQSITQECPTAACDMVKIGSATLYAVASTTDPTLMRKMTIDRLAYALSDCRTLPGVANKYNDINLQIVRKA